MKNTGGPLRPARFGYTCTGKSQLQSLEGGACPPVVAVAVASEEYFRRMYGFRVAAELKPWIRYFYHTDPAFSCNRLNVPCWPSTDQRYTGGPGGKYTGHTGRFTERGNQQVMVQCFPRVETSLFPACGHGRVR